MGYRDQRRGYTAFLRFESAEQRSVGAVGRSDSTARASLLSRLDGPANVAPEALSASQSWLFFRASHSERPYFPILMRTSYLPIIVVASALSLTSANAMPNLGRETGKFIRSDEPTPKDVRTFEPAKTEKPQASLRFLAPWKSQISLSFLAPWKSRTSLGFLAPWKPQADLTFLGPWRHGSGSIA